MVCRASLHGFSCCPTRLIPTRTAYVRRLAPDLSWTLLDASIARRAHVHCTCPRAQLHRSFIAGHPGQQANVISNLARSAPRHLVIRLCTHPSFISPTAAVLSRVAARPEAVPSDTCESLDPCTHIHSSSHFYIVCLHFSFFVLFCCVCWFLGRVGERRAEEALAGGQGSLGRGGGNGTGARGVLLLGIRLGSWHFSSALHRQPRVSSCACGLPA